MRVRYCLWLSFYSISMRYEIHSQLLFHWKCEKLDITKYTHRVSVRWREKKKMNQIKEQLECWNETDEWINKVFTWDSRRDRDKESEKPTTTPNNNVHISTWYASSTANISSENKDAHTHIHLVYYFAVSLLLSPIWFRSLFRHFFHFVTVFVAFSRLSFSLCILTLKAYVRFAIVLSRRNRISSQPFSRH